MDKLKMPTIQELQKINEANDTEFDVGDSVKFKPEALDNVNEPELINLDLIYTIVKISPKFVIEDMYGNAQRINKKDIKYLIKL